MEKTVVEMEIRREILPAGGSKRQFQAATTGLFKEVKERFMDQTRTDERNNPSPKVRQDVFLRDERGSGKTTSDVGKESHRGLYYCGQRDRDKAVSGQRH